MKHNDLSPVMQSLHNAHGVSFRRKIIVYLVVIQYVGISRGIL